MLATDKMLKELKKLVGENHIEQISKAGGMCLDFPHGLTCDIEDIRKILLDYEYDIWPSPTTGELFSVWSGGYTRLYFEPLGSPLLKS